MDNASPTPTPRIGWAQAQKMGIWVHEDAVINRDDTPLESVLEALRVYPTATRLVTLTTAAFEEYLEQAFHQAGEESQQIAQDMDLDIDLITLTEEIPENADLLSDDESAPVIRLINAILSEAVKEGASDIHIETFEKTLSIRFRTDGVLRQVLQPGRKLAPLLISRIKVMAKLDIAEKRLPQDGRITLRLGRRNIDVRVSTLPSRHGERAVLRLLDKNNLTLSVDKLGLSEQDAERLEQVIHQPHGIILVTGPTGSGKSTTLYAMLSALNTPGRNILTVEDPVEYELDGIGQTQVNPRVDMSFARGLRAILRQDPDVVMVGEIRDNETAQIAVQASLTGHLVLSTLHTNSAAGAITRLRDMAVEPFLLSSSLIGVLAQRLVRRLCPHCRKLAPLAEHQASFFHDVSPLPSAVWTAQGCASCHHSGYQGRLAIHELMLIDRPLRVAIHDNASEQDIENAFRQSSKTLLQNGLLRVLNGDTSLEEVIRVTAQHNVKEA
ncbi:general secretion pathway protein E [Trabulsiella guamensis ATCC 49490]|uniref:Type II secretion system protein E n=1 Tax=Trabulsiella guamensis ATCC 49490 TaxID=1005994 RepID=A0A085A4L7_9ENTR|nr:type II secretion system ATPase GspE [Trabulsiella guamensis]KFC05162.1 general secretion pathway protein E [Trabulsiella guamensis ATCC 49490]